MRAPVVLLFPFFLLCLTSPAAVAALDTYSTGYPDCPIVECGDFNISYPFWVYPNPVSGANPSTYCGYRGLNITCDGGNKPVFHTLTDNYTVKSVNRSSNTISLIDANVVGKTCPRAIHSVTIQNAPALNFTPDAVTITFYFNCSSTTKDLNIPDDNVAGCLDGEAGLSYIFNSTNPPSPEVNATLLKECKGLPIESRVRREDIGKTILGKAFGDAMNKGFDLMWNLYDNNLATCKSCELAEGRCGSLNTESGNAFHCFCTAESSKCQQYWQSQQQKAQGW